RREASLEVGENESLLIAPSGKTQSSEANADAFVHAVRRSLARRAAIPLPGTGQGLQPGELDPNWYVAAMSSGPQFALRPAAVIYPLQWQYAKPSDDARWISFLDRGYVVPGQSTTTFRTRFDLTDFDETTVVVQGKYAV